MHFVGNKWLEKEQVTLADTVSSRTIYISSNEQEQNMLTVLLTQIHYWMAPCCWVLFHGSECKGRHLLTGQPWILNNKFLLYFSNRLLSLLKTGSYITECCVLEESVFKTKARLLRVQD